MRKQKQALPGIILDEPYTNGLLAKALESGYAKITFPSDYTTGILNKARNPRVGQKALEMLLLYDKVYTVSWFDNTEFDQLSQLGLLEIVPSTWNQVTVEEEHARSIKGLLLADLERKGFNLTPDQFDILLPDVNAMYLGNVILLAERLQPSLEKIFGSSQSRKRKQDDSPSLVEMFKDQVEVAQRRTKSDFELGRKIQYSYGHIRNLLEASAQLNVPIFSNIRRVPKVGAGIDKQVFDPNTRLALGIYMKETLTIPKTDTMEDVLRLRNDSRIRNFREKISKWCTKLRAGEIGSEDAIRAEIREANAAIEDIGKYKKIGMWVTFLSVPIGVAEFLMGLPISLLTVTPLGVGLEVTSILKERKYRWLLFGR